MYNKAELNFDFYCLLLWWAVFGVNQEQYQLAIGSRYSCGPLGAGGPHRSWQTNGPLNASKTLVRKTTYS